MWQKRHMAISCATDPPAPFATSSLSAALPPERIGEYIHAYGAERILFGTDFPLWDPVSEVKLLDSLRLTDSELEQITSKNAHTILD